MIERYTNIPENDAAPDKKRVENINMLEWGEGQGQKQTISENAESNAVLAEKNFKYKRSKLRRFELFQKKKIDFVKACSS